MDSEHQIGHSRKHKRIPRPPLPPLSSSLSPHYSVWPLLVLCFIFILLLLHGFSAFASSAFRPVLIISRLPLLLSSSSSTTSSSILDSLDDDAWGPLPLKVEDRVLFPDHVFLLVSNSKTRRTKTRGPSLLRLLHQNTALYCVYPPQSSSITTNNSISLPLLSADEFDDHRSIARCPTPPANHSARVLLQRRGIREHHHNNREEELQIGIHHPVHSWETLVYSATLDRDTAVVFVKGLNLRPDRASDPKQFVCHFGWGNWQRHSRFVLTTKALTAAQEVVRCSLPTSIRNNPARAHGLRVTIGAASLGASSRVRRNTPPLYIPLPSIAKIFNSTTTQAEPQEEEKKKKKYELCVCSMVWNQASSLREWIIYHAWLGVESWYIYDNNSEDDIKKVIEELDQEKYNVSRHVWPWLKTQEAGFSHCTLRAKAECNWVGFMDVDEFFYFPPLPSSSKYPGRDSLKSLVTNFSSSTTIGEIRTACHSFGPSGLTTPPSQGVTVGYTCRLQSPERHKSIVRPNALDDTLLNVVHHFRLKTGYTYLNMPQSTAIVNHYKYQVWEAFRAKFFRRVATYVADWQENQNEGSKDRAPGLGTEAIEPPNWRLQFCEVWDTGLRDFVMANLADPATGVLPWDWKSSLQ